MGKTTMEAVQVGIGYDLRCVGCNLEGNEWTLATMLAPAETTRNGIVEGEAITMLTYLAVCETCYDTWLSRRPLVESEGAPVIRLRR